MVNAESGVYQGSFVANRGGTSIGIALSGLDFDRNRGWLWTGSENIYALEVPSGEVVVEFLATDRSGVNAVAYDPVLDRIWETDYGETVCYRPDGLVVCDVLGSAYTDVGLGHDGVDLWRCLNDQLPPPAPPDPWYLLPSETENRIDHLSRAVSLADQYRDIAFDCVTFGVPVVWVTDLWLGCFLTAYEVVSRAPGCIQAPGIRLLRGQTEFADRASIATKLPLVTANMNYVNRQWGSPFDFLDDREAVLANTDLRFVAYRVLGDGDAPQTGVLRLVKDVPSRGIRVVY